MTKVLVILTSATRWSQKDGSQRPTGFWAEEFVVPHRILAAAHVQLTIATPGGMPAPVDELSFSAEANNGDQAHADEMRAYVEAHRDVLQTPARLEDVDPTDFDGVLIPGGHGPMQDLVVNADVGRVLAATLPDQSKVVASVCHGPASFFAAGAPDGGWLFKGRKLTAFTDEEEQQAGLAENSVWLLEKRLRGAGAEFSSGPAWGSYVVVDGNLITGQNPASGSEVAEALLKALAERA